MTDDKEINGSKFNQKELTDLIARYVDENRIPKNLKIITDTSNFFQVDYNDVMILEDRPYFIRNYEREGRFTIDEQPKFWVRKAIDLTDGGMKIIKMVFHEKFNARVGDLIFECFRSPKKESRILDLTKGHRNFMQGKSAQDSAGNIIRIIDHISGKNMADHAASLSQNHEDYFFNHFPSILESFIELTEAIRFLHEQGEKHGDIRRDHIILDSRDGVFKWIDFDYNFRHKENMFGYDMFGLGNILVFLAACDEITIQSVGRSFPELKDTLNNGDLNIIFDNRVVNLKKIYPYIPEKLNYMLMHFSKSAEIFYEDTEQFLSDLYEAREVVNFC